MKHTTTAIWLYGSDARGDTDRKSDSDVLVISDSPPSRQIVAQIAQADLARLAISQYSWPEIEGMASYGSLFLHHVRLEGRPLFEGNGVSGRLRGILSVLGPYRRAPVDLRSFRLTVSDIRKSLSEGGSLTFELSVLGTVVRHTAILACYISGHPTFGRIEPVRKLVNLWNLDPNLPSLFVELYNSRLYTDYRSEAPSDVSMDAAYDWCDRLEEILDQLEVHAHEHERRLQTKDSPRERIGV